jgi:hypothetical protein
LKIDDRRRRRRRAGGGLGIRPFRWPHCGRRPPRSIRWLFGRFGPRLSCGPHCRYWLHCPCGCGRLAAATPALAAFRAVTRHHPLHRLLWPAPLLPLPLQISGCNTGHYDQQVNNESCLHRCCRVPCVCRATATATATATVDQKPRRQKCAKMLRRRDSLLGNFPWARRDGRRPLCAWAKQALTSL